MKFRGAVLSRILVAVASAALLPACGDTTGLAGAGYPLLPATESSLTAEQRSAYQEDAVRLAIRHLIATNSPARNNVNPPAELVTSLYSALLAVHASVHPARDTVIDILRIRTFGNPPVYEIMVSVDKSAPWADAWRNGTALTGNAAVDALVSTHELSVKQYYYWGNDEVALLRAAKPLNAHALSSRFAALPGVRWAEGNGFGGDGNDIRATLENGAWRLSYSLGFGDCPAGCINRYTWTFRVAPSGSVQYLGGSGSGWQTP